MQKMALRVFLGSSVLSSTQNGIHWWPLGWLKRDTHGGGGEGVGRVGRARRTGFKWVDVILTNQHRIQALNPLGSPAAL